MTAFIGDAPCFRPTLNEGGGTQCAVWPHLRVSSQVSFGPEWGDTLNTNQPPATLMNSKLYVGNLTFETTEADLRGLFEQFGTIEDVHVVSDRYTGRPRGFAFVTFSTEAESKLATEKLNGTEMNGRALTVNEAKPSGAPGGARQFSSPNRRAGAFHARGKRHN